MTAADLSALLVSAREGLGIALLISIGHLALVPILARTRSGGPAATRVEVMSA